MINEVWRDIFGYEGFYQVSNLGRVKSMTTYTIASNRIGRVYPSRIRKLNKHCTGYLQVQLTKDKKAKSFRVHRLVARAFLSDFSEDLEVNHKDMNRANNHVDNLEMVTHAENMAHAREMRGYGKTKTR